MIYRINLKFNSNVIYLKILVLLVIFSISINTYGQDNKLYENINIGEYQVGFTELQLTDFGRTYKGDFRKIQVAVWFPTQSDSIEKVKIIDYLSLYNTEDSFEDKVNINEFWSNQFQRLNKNVNTAELFSQSTIATKKELQFNEGYPLILYAAGGQGESFENFLICEALASHGFVVAAIPSVGTYDHEMEITEEGLVTQTQDLLSVLRYMNNETQINGKNIGVFGWSWGGLVALYLQTRYSDVQGIVSLDGSIAGYSEVMEALPYYGIEKITTPTLYFSTSEDTKIRTMDFVNRSLYSNRSFISLDSIEHSQFNSYHHLAKFFPGDGSDDHMKTFYPAMTNMVSRFYVHNLTNRVSKPFEVEGSFPLIDTAFAKSGVEAPLREDELIALIKEVGAVAGKQEYEKMKRLNPEYVPFRAFELTKAAFSLVRDSLRSNEAVQIMEIVIKEYSNSPSSYALKGRVHEIRGENQLALDNFKKALSLKKGNEQPAEVVFYEDINWYRKKVEELEQKLSKKS